ncbi:uncharacterized protein LOC123545759 [Mercenaria mercenaria]|uniref:uncharacterized protein LOC123545759 n=1 Tax=Mercenaria mercenaria TaxID=6596 RepID=UPI00234E4176|nr:uncharacterized protein LOC123545759 [Mercenaria mercenaria]
MRAIFITTILLASCLPSDAFLFRRRRNSATASSSSITNCYCTMVKGNLVGTDTPLRKRSVEMSGNRYDVRFQVDPCNFKTYDIDQNLEITKSELHDIFGDDEKVNALFKALDSPIVDGVIEAEEFYSMAPETIVACADYDE